MAKTATDRAHDAIIKVVSDRGVNFHLLANKLQKQPQWVREALWDLICAYIKVWEIESRHPSVSNSESDLIFADKMARLNKYL